MPARKTADRHAGEITIDARAAGCAAITAAA